MRLLDLSGDGRRIRYLGILGWTCGESEAREDEKEDDVNGMGASGVKDSLVIIIGRAKRLELEVKLLKAVCSSDEAVGHVLISLSCCILDL